MGILSGKTALITGVMSEHSIAHGIAEAFHEAGAELAFTYVDDKFKPRVEKATEAFSPKAILQCDVTSDEQIEQLFTDLNQVWDHVDIIIHAIAFAPRDQIGGNFLEQINREGFSIAHDVSAYSFCALAKAARPMLHEGSALLTLSYLGAERAFTNYNTMGLAKASLEAATRYMAQSLGEQGIRVNAISAGPIKTLAASGIKGFRKMLEANKKRSPLNRNVTTREVGDAATFLCSDMASAITGEVLHVDCGFSMVGLDAMEME